MLCTYSINHIEIEVSKVEDKLEEDRGKVQGGDQNYKNDEKECDKLKTHNTQETKEITTKRRLGDIFPELRDTPTGRLKWFFPFWQS